MKFKHLFPSLLIVMMFTSCNGQSAAIKNLNADEFEKGITTAGAQIVDVRTPEEYKSRHIAGAVNMNVNDADFEKQLSSLDKTKPVYLYCLAGSRSKKAGEIAVNDGFTNVSNLETGMNGWIGAKKPVTNSNGEAPAAGMTFEEYLAHIKNPDKLILVDFNAVWCGPCKQLHPIVVRQVKKHSEKLELFEVDVDKNPRVANTMNITGIPLLILYKNGKEVWRSMGLIEESELAGKLKEFTN